VPVRTSWRYNLPGAALTLGFWILGSYALRWVLTITAGQSTSIYGPLAAPIAILLWLYVLSIAVLIGAALNAAFDRVWPESETSRARRELVRRLRLKSVLPRLRRDREEHERFGAAAYDESSKVYDEAAEAYDEPAEAADEPARRDKTPDVPDGAMDQREPLSGADTERNHPARRPRR
jgi:membrane protein